MRYSILLLLKLDCNRILLSNGKVGGYALSGNPWFI